MMTMGGDELEPELKNRQQVTVDERVLIPPAKDEILANKHGESSGMDDKHCLHCEKSAEWDGKRKYSWRDKEFVKLSVTLQFPEEDWKSMVSYNNRGEPSFQNSDYSTIIASEWRKLSNECGVIGIKRTKLLKNDSTLQLYAYCAEGNQQPCKLFLLKYVLHDKVCNPSDGSKLFEVWESTNLRLHCTKYKRSFQLRGRDREIAKKESTKYAPIEYENKMIISTQTDKIVCEKPDFPISTHTIHNLRREARQEDYLAIHILESLHSMWLVEAKLPAEPKEGKSEFRFLQHVSLCPLQVIAFSMPQMKILHQEYSNFEPTSDKPRYLPHLDGTGAIVSKPHGRRNNDWDNKKMRMLFTLVAPVKIPGDTSKPTIFPFATFITNDKSTESIRLFLWKFKVNFKSCFGYFPPFDGIVTDQDWAEIGAILHEFNDMDVSQYLEETYKYAIEGKSIPRGELVLVQLCCVHLYKHILNDTEKFFKESSVRQVINVMFVHITHARTYQEVMNVIDRLIIILLANEEEKKSAVRDIILFEHCKLQFDELCGETVHNLVDATNSKDAIYKKSPYYKDCSRRIESAQTRYSCSDKQNELDFLRHISRQYFAILPMMSAFLVATPQSDKVLTFVRFSNAYAESYFSMLKETLRKMVNRIGKLPIRIDILLKALKESVLAFVLRYKNEIARKPGKRVKHIDLKESDNDSCSFAAIVDRFVDQTITEQLDNIPSPKTPKTVDAVLKGTSASRKRYVTQSSTSNAAIVDQTIGGQLGNIPSPRTPTIIDAKLKGTSVSRKRYVTHDEVDKAASQWKRSAKNETPPRTPMLPATKKARSIFNLNMTSLANEFIQIKQLDEITWVPIVKSSLEPTRKSKLLVQSNQPTCRLGNGFYPNARFYHHELKEPVGFINIDEHDFGIRKEDFASLAKGKMITNFILENIAQIMISKSEVCDMQLIAFNDTYTFFNPQPQDDEIVKYRFHKACYKNKRTWIAPILMGAHFWMVIINFKEQTIHYFDSIRNSKRLQTTVEAFFKCAKVAGVDAGHISNVKEWKVFDIDVPQQEDGISCGVHLLRSLEAFLTGNAIDKFNSDQYRECLQVFILQNFVSLDSICSYCGKGDSKSSNYVSCTYCGRKTHVNCKDKYTVPYTEDTNGESLKCKLCVINKMSIRRICRK